MIDKCPECGARAEVLGGFLVCRGPIDVTDAVVFSAEAALKEDSSWGGPDVRAKDRSLRTLATQKTCGRRWNPDGSVIVRIPEGQGPPDFTQGKDG